MKHPDNLKIKEEIETEITYYLESTEKETIKPLRLIKSHRGNSPSGASTLKCFSPMAPPLKGPQQLFHMVMFIYTITQVKCFCVLFFLTEPLLTFIPNYISCGPHKLGSVHFCLNCFHYYEVPKPELWEGSNCQAISVSLQGNCWHSGKTSLCCMEPSLSIARHLAPLPPRD